MAKSKGKRGRGKGKGKSKGGQANKKTESPSQPETAQQSAFKNNKTKPSLPVQFPYFKEFPQEIQNSIWKQALIAEVKHTFVIHDSKTGGLLPSVKLISSISTVNKAARTIATEFYNVKLDVFACTREPPEMILQRRQAKGVLRLNLEYTALFLGRQPPWYVFRLDLDEIEDIGEEFEDGRDNQDYVKWSGTRPQGDSSIWHDKQLWITRSHITAPLDEPQRAQVKRIYQEESSPVDDCYWEPPCCWGCSWESANFPCEGAYSSHKESQFPNVWLCRLFITDFEYQLDMLVTDYAKVPIEELWELMRGRFVTCDDFPVRRAGDDFEPDPDREW
ncbi:hypothetical protein PFICI_00819 [Pestalotiopsis fici W106-1]|uniref:2EXR domain-containing protein n=1 Tax=Pestalotiopsis fici (strain W106-1 / CGMCC3.15140) TaxID=1229662 RepID=W3XNY8_PESFW|nr:uncharacterized protein PFICI_00819 [Pestalotiopsis fici W106-1]ETS86991.1 hypothetical protein PFICI_00819 [Pestalotiopsis fici W106-1]